jgi:hypothetical protein
MMAAGVWGGKEHESVGQSPCFEARVYESFIALSVTVTHQHIQQRKRTENRRR